MIAVGKAGMVDVEQLIQLRLDYVAEDCGSLTDAQTAALRQQLPGYFARHLGQDLVVFVARDEQMIVACCFLLLVEKPANLAFISGLTGTVLNVYTKPAYRRQGIAEQLMRALLDEAGERKLDFVELKATEAGLPLYRKLGFEENASPYVGMKYAVNVKTH